HLEIFHSINLSYSSFNACTFLFFWGKNKMRIFSPMTTENWREIWWSNVSFCPEMEFHNSLIRYGFAASAFLLIYLGLSLRERKSNQ
ncbi:MAG: hypothetical protein U9N73_12570, partial [Candidatus Auribacterota bacterium]|nr:hypothetical protein [Candidatus Auribacterota bacterium]